MFDLCLTFKICIISGQGVGRIDSGAGLTFLHANSYYLTGLVSSKDPNNSISVFTDIKYHIHWIRRFIILHVRKYIYLKSLILDIFYCKSVWIC